MFIVCFAGSSYLQGIINACGLAKKEEHKFYLMSINVEFFLFYLLFKKLT